MLGHILNGLSPASSVIFCLQWSPNETPDKLKIRHGGGEDIQRQACGAEAPIPAHNIFFRSRASASTIATRILVDNSTLHSWDTKLTYSATFFILNRHRALSCTCVTRVNACVVRVTRTATDAVCCLATVTYQLLD